MKTPQTPAEWQDVVDLAHAMLTIDAARQYGLITGGPEIDVNRCLELLEQGHQQGIEPSADAIERVVAAYQAEAGREV